MSSASRRQVEQAWLDATNERDRQVGRGPERTGDRARPAALGSAEGGAAEAAADGDGGGGGVGGGGADVVGEALSQVSQDPSQGSPRKGSEGSQ